MCIGLYAHAVAPVRAKAPEKIFGRAPACFSSKSTINRFGEPFRDGQYSLVSFLFAVLLLMVPLSPTISKRGGMCPRAIWSRRHCAHRTSVYVRSVCSNSLVEKSISEASIVKELEKVTCGNSGKLFGEGEQRIPT